jgi:hypothetical protein
MRTTPAILSLLLALPLPAAALEIGAKLPAAPEKLRNVDGKEALLSSFSGPKGTLVIFSCNHCPFAKAWEGRIVALGNKLKGSGLGVVMVNSNDPSRVPEDGYEAMRSRAREKGYPFPYVVDATSNLARSFGATRTPEAFLFDGAGKLVYQGAVDDNSESPEKVKDRFLENAADALLAGKPVPLATTQTIGCTIKFRS